jgi:hypothetical protein
MMVTVFPRGHHCFSSTKKSDVSSIWTRNPQKSRLPIDFYESKTTKLDWLVKLNPSEKYEFVSWDDDIPNIWKNVPNHQPD